MKKSDTFLNLVGWVIAGAIFATGAVLFNPWKDSKNDKTAVVPQEVPIAFVRQ